MTLNPMEQESIMLQNRDLEKEIMKKLNARDADQKDPPTPEQPDTTKFTAPENIPSYTNPRANDEKRKKRLSAKILKRLSGDWGFASKEEDNQVSGNTKNPDLPLSSSTDIKKTLSENKPAVSAKKDKDEEKRIKRLSAKLIKRLSTERTAYAISPTSSDNECIFWNENQETAKNSEKIASEKDASREESIEPYKLGSS